MNAAPEQPKERQKQWFLLSLPQLVARTPRFCKTHLQKHKRKYENLPVGCKLTEL